MPPSRLPKSGKLRGKQVRRLRNQFRRLLVGQREWVKYIHYFSINYLWSLVDVVINPVLRSSQLVPREGRVFGSASARSLLTMSHYKFNQRLRSSTARDAGRHVIDWTGEPGTSKTCPNPECGRWHAELGGNAVFVCPQRECRVAVGRDFNGARGNALAALGKAEGVAADATSDH